MTFEPQRSSNGPPSAGAIESELLDFVSSRVPDDEPLTSDTDLLESELLDSLLIMDLVAHVESVHGVKLENADISPRHFRTLGLLSKLVAERRS
jgi:acyl carrier protein